MKIEDLKYTDKILLNKQLSNKISLVHEVSYRGEDMTLKILWSLEKKELKREIRRLFYDNSVAYAVENRFLGAEEGKQRGVPIYNPIHDVFWFSGVTRAKKIMEMSLHEAHDYCEDQYSKIDWSKYNLEKKNYRNCEELVVFVVTSRMSILNKHYYHTAGW